MRRSVKNLFQVGSVQNCIALELGFQRSPILFEKNDKTRLENYLLFFKMKKFQQKFFRHPSFQSTSIMLDQYQSKQLESTWGFNGLL